MGAESRMTWWSGQKAEERTFLAECNIVPNVAVRLQQVKGQYRRIILYKYGNQISQWGGVWLVKETDVWVTWWTLMVTLRFGGEINCSTVTSQVFWGRESFGEESPSWARKLEATCMLSMWGHQYAWTAHLDISRIWAYSSAMFRNSVKQDTRSTQQLSDATILMWDASTGESSWDKYSCWFGKWLKS